MPRVASGGRTAALLELCVGGGVRELGRVNNDGCGQVKHVPNITEPSSAIEA